MTRKRVVYTFTNSWDDTVSEIDVTARRVTRTMTAGYQPIGIALDSGARTLYVANRLGGNVSVLDLSNGRERQRIMLGPGTSYVTLAPATRTLYVTRVFPTMRDSREVPQNEIVAIDTGTHRITSRYAFPGAGAIFHARFSADGRAGIAAVLQPKNLIPTARVAHGGVFVNSIAIVGPALPRPTILPLDSIDSSLAQPFDIAVAHAIGKVFVSASGADEVAVLDSRRLFASARAPDAAGLANNLSVSGRYVISRISTGRNPRGLALSADSKRLYVANRLDDTITLIDTVRGVSVGTILLRESALTPERRGEQNFYSARFAFGRQFSCSSCHLDGHTDGLSWDLEQDGFGVDIVATKGLEQLAATAPYKWNGTTPDLETECGILSERYFFRSQGFRGAELSDVVAFLRSIPVRPNRYRLPDGKLTPAQARGKAIFERSTTKAGTTILPVLRCYNCHFGSAFSSNQSFDVGTKQATDRVGRFDTPELMNVGYRTSFLHDGAAKTLREIWTSFNPLDLHGVTSDLDSRELDDLVEYLKSL